MKIQELKRYSLSKVSKTYIMDKRQYVLYNNHKRKSRRKHLVIKDREEFINFGRSFFRAISENFLKSKAGVKIEGFGYFTPLMCPYKKTYVTPQNGKKDNYNFHTDNYVYSLVFKPVASISFWSMDYSFSSAIKKKFVKSLREGVRYKTYIYSLTRSHEYTRFTLRGER